MGDAADRDRELGGHSHRHRIETSLLPLKKRASNYSSCAGRISAGDPYSPPSKKRGAGRISAGDPYSPSSKKRKKSVDDDSLVGAETKDTAGALEAQAPVPRQRRRTVPAAAPREPAAEELPAPAAASPEPAAEGSAAALSDSDEEKKRLSKGKWLAKDESRSTLVTPVKKLMHDGIRSFIPQQLRDEHRRAALAAVPPSDGRRSPTLSVALERRLKELDATPPWLVLSKTLRKSDVDVNQNRLLVSCKRGSGSQDSPITRCFSPAELDRVNMKLAGLCITAFDRGGFPYALTCKFLESNNGYRFITEWKKFLIQNGMDLGSQKDKDWKRDVEVELWAFRSRRLPFQPQVDAEGNVQVDQWESHHLHADGALGLLLLHHEKRRRVVKSEEEDDHDDDDDDWKQGPSLSSPSVARKKKGKQQIGKRKRGAAASPAPVVALPAPVAEQELLFCAAVGLERLRQSIAKQWQEYVDGGHGANKGLSNDVATSSADVAKSSADVEEERISKRQKRPGTHSTKERGGE